VERTAYGPRHQGQTNRNRSIATSVDGHGAGGGRGGGCDSLPADGQTDTEMCHFTPTPSHLVRSMRQSGKIVCVYT
jgi:hypothetical protein